MYSPLKRKTSGPVPRFTDYHIWKALMLFDDREPLGRKKLASALGIGEGSARTILDMLGERGYVTTGARGTILTEKGIMTRDSTYMEFATLPKSYMTIGLCDCAVVVPRMAKRVQYGCEERDVAILAGALGATTLVYTDGIIKFPGSDSYPVEDALCQSIFSRLEVEEGDAIVIGTAKTPERAEKGAISAALALMGGMPITRDLKDIMTTSSAADEIISLAFAVHDLVGGLPVCAKSRDNLGIRIEDGSVIDNAYTGDILEEVINIGTTVRKTAVTGPYKGLKVIVAPIDLHGVTIASIGVVDMRSAAGYGNINIVNF